MILDFAILFSFHFIFDFLLQSRTTAKNKSSNMRYLLGHLFCIMFGILLAGMFFESMTPSQVFKFALINTILHGLIDWNIWNVYKLTVIKRFPVATDKFEFWEDSWFYAFIGLDQLLHSLCYLSTYLLFQG